MIKESKQLINMIMLLVKILIKNKQVIEEYNATIFANSIIELRNDPQKGTILQGLELKNVLNENEDFKSILKGNTKYRI